MRLGQFIAAIGKILGGRAKMSELEESESEMGAMSDTHSK